MQKARSLNELRILQRTLQRARLLYWVRAWGMDIDPSVLLSLSAKLDRTYPAGVHIGRDSYVAFGAAILTHDMTRGLYLHTRVGANCFIGARSVLMPGITVGDGSIVGTGAVVTKDVEPGTIVVGNPATVLRSGVEVGRYGRLVRSEG